ncbi:MAG: hypothetical protein DMG16_29325, partial [Acidobacteria bacterium]
SHQLLFQLHETLSDRRQHATALIFPTPGCWQVTGHVGSVSVTFVTKVIKIDEDPHWRRDP